MGSDLGARERIMRSRERFWRREDLPGAAKTVSNTLSRLVRDGELRQVRRGLYWRGTRTALGMSPPPEDQLAAALAGTGRGVGPAGLSAASALRLSTQVPSRREIAVPGRAPASTGGVRFTSRAARTGRVTAGLLPLEVAFLEVLGDLSASELSPAQSLRRLGEMLDGADLVRPGKLAAAAATEPASIRVRLACLLAAHGHSGLAARIPPADPRAAARALADTARG